MKTPILTYNGAPAITIGTTICVYTGTPMAPDLHEVKLIDHNYSFSFRYDKEFDAVNFFTYIFLQLITRRLGGSKLEKWANKNKGEILDAVRSMGYVFPEVNLDFAKPVE